jgi:Mg-chelatase subunit ChlI
VQIVSERSTFDEDPAAFHKKYADKQVCARGFRVWVLGFRLRYLCGFEFGAGQPSTRSMQTSRYVADVVTDG